MNSSTRPGWLRRTCIAVRRVILGKSSREYMKQFTGSDEYFDEAIAAQKGWPQAIAETQGRYSMSRLRQIEQDLLVTGKIDGSDLEMLRRHLYADNGKIDRLKADFLVELHKRVQHLTPAFEQFFYQAVKDHILADGWIDGQNAVWLRNMLTADGKISDEERKLLHELKGEAKKVSREFEQLFAECMDQPQEQRTCG